MKNVSQAKAIWKVLYRALRVARREGNKAAMDVLLYGTGAVFFPSDGADPRHVPIEQIRFKVKDPQ